MSKMITLVNDDDFAPVFGVSGSIVIKRYQVYGPTISGEARIDGSLAVKIPRPNLVTPMAGQVVIQGNIKAGVRSPAAAFKDFAHYPYQGIDPAMARIGVTSGALTSAPAGSYARQYASFTGPVDYPVSGNGYAWKRAAYASVGFKFNNMSANKHQILDAVQFEPMPLGATGPSTYQNARSIQVVIKPTRLNYALNPNMESDITGYGTTGQATLAADAFCWKGTQALKVTMPTTATQDSGFSFQVSGLIPGRQYTMSARVAIAQGCADISPWSGTGSSQATRKTWKQAARTMDPTNKRWRTLSVTFTSGTSSLSLGMNAVKSSATPGVASIFWVDAVLVEQGGAVRPYFDGSMGADYLWETSGTANLTRSYYYENRVERSYLIRTLLDENTPLGITSAVPQYAVLPTQ
jgi:hypothetical protein